MKTFIAVYMTLMMMCIGFVSSRCEATANPEQLTAARKWLALVDYI